MAIITAGRLKDKIVISRPIETTDGSGGYTGDYQDVVSTYAEVIEESSNSELIAQGIKIKQTLRMRIRWRPNFSFLVGDRVNWRGFLFIIENMRVDMWRTYIEIIASPSINTSYRGPEFPIGSGVFDTTFDITFG